MANDLKKFKLVAAIFLSSSALIWLVVYSIILTLSGCGKKSEPKYQGKFNHIQIVL